MSGSDPIQLVARLIRATCESTKREGGSKTWNARERSAAKNVLSALLGRLPTETEMEQVFEI